ncbi:hypothetical protein DFP73DRAFT_526385 [Morchella snyderi]|nr:hypothetical protein DFP73DRAFT_526385 [Morchella snyderi]
MSKQDQDYKIAYWLMSLMRSIHLWLKVYQYFSILMFLKMFKPRQLGPNANRKLAPINTSFCARSPSSYPVWYLHEIRAPVSSSAQDLPRAPGRSLKEMGT